MAIFIETKKMPGQTDGKVANAVFYTWGNCLGSPDMLLTSKDSGFIMSDFSQFRIGPNITLPAVITGLRQSL